MCPHADPTAASGRVEVQLVPETRVRPIGSNDEFSPSEVARDDKPGDPAGLQVRSLDARSGARGHAGSVPGSGEQSSIQVPAAITSPCGRDSGNHWKAPLRLAACEMVPDSDKRRAFARITYPQSVERSHACGHESFSARFFFRELATLEQFHGQAHAPEMDCRCRSRRASPRYQYVRHVVALPMHSKFYKI
jgi:hypothetical protein